MSGKQNGPTPFGMTCSDVETYLADYLDKTLDAGHRTWIKKHLDSCPSCNEFAQDIASAMELMERSAEVEPPPELVNKLLFEVTSGASRSVVRPSWLVRVASSVFGKWLEPILQPRMAMGMAMTVLSLGMLLRVDRVRAMQPSDLNPVELYAAAEDKVAGWWDSAMKYYVSMRVVFEIEAMYQEWMEQQAAEADNPPAQAPDTGETESAPADAPGVLPEAVPQGGN